jgi:hypothetical protein
MLVRSLMIAGALVLGSTPTTAQDECAGLRKITEVKERVGAALDSLKGKATGGGNPKEGRLEFESKFRLPDFNCVIESIAASQGKRAQRAVVCTRKLASKGEADALHDAFPYAKCLSSDFVCTKKKDYGSTLATACARMQPTILVFWSTRSEQDPLVRLSIRYVGD